VAAQRVVARDMNRSRQTSAHALISASALTQRWVIASDLALIQPVVDTIVTLCREAGFSSRHCQLNVPVAMTEALANAVLRGNFSDPSRSVTVQLRLDTAGLVVEVTDEGLGFDLSAVQQSPAEQDWFEREDGRGVFLMQHLMDRVESAPVPSANGHCLRLTLHRA
jgi:serine/threonine-protein kinase RsbW